MKSVPTEEQLRAAARKLYSADPLSPLLLIGPPGSMKTMLARRIHQAVVDEWSHSDTYREEILWLYYGAGLKQPKDWIPFRAPHHTVSHAGMAGSWMKRSRDVKVNGRWTRKPIAPRLCPGEVSLAHGGVLFLDEAPEFLRQPLEAVSWAVKHGCMELHHRYQVVRLPAKFFLVMAANPCPCGAFIRAKSHKCTCSDAQRARYLARVTDQFDCRVVQMEEIKWE